MSTFEIETNLTDFDNYINIYKLSLPLNKELMSSDGFNKFSNKFINEDKNEIMEKVDDSVYVVINPILDQNVNIMDNISIAYKDNVK
jgi:hypothetical protein